MFRMNSELFSKISAGSVFVASFSDMLLAQQGAFGGSENSKEAVVTQQEKIDYCRKREAG